MLIPTDARNQDEKITYDQLNEGTIVDTAYKSQTKAEKKAGILRYS